MESVTLTKEEYQAKVEYWTSQAPSLIAALELRQLMRPLVGREEDWVIKAFNHFNSYEFLLRDDYPPAIPGQVFSLEEGGATAFLGIQQGDVGKSVVVFWRFFEVEYNLEKENV